MKALVEKLSNGTYRATPIGLPLFAEGESEADALRELREILAATPAHVVDMTGQAKPVPLLAFASDVKDHPATEAFDQLIDSERERVEAEVNAVVLAGDDPAWQKLNGLLADDPHFEDFLDGIRAFRATRDAEDFP